MSLWANTIKWWNLTPGIQNRYLKTVQFAQPPIDLRTSQPRKPINRNHCQTRQKLQPPLTLTISQKNILTWMGINGGYMQKKLLIIEDNKSISSVIKHTRY